MVPERVPGLGNYEGVDLEGAITIVDEAMAAIAKFDELGEQARELGFIHVASGPLVRSSYHADEFRGSSLR